MSRGNEMDERYVTDGHHVPSADSYRTFNPLEVGSTVLKQLTEAEANATFSLAQRGFDIDLDDDVPLILWLLARFLSTASRVTSYFGYADAEAFLTSFSIAFSLEPEAICQLSNGKVRGWACTSGTTSNVTIYAYASRSVVKPTGLSESVGCYVYVERDGSAWVEIRLRLVLPEVLALLHQNLKLKTTITLVNRGNGSVSQTKESHSLSFEFAFKAPSDVTEFLVDDELKFRENINIIY